MRKNKKVCNEKKSKEVVCERKWEESNKKVARTNGYVTYFWISTVKLSGVIN